MINHILKSILLVTLSTSLIIGCSATKNLLSKENYTKNTVPHKKTTFRRVWAVEDNEEFRVSGRLRLKGSLGTNIPAYVKVDLVDKDGTVIETRKVGYTPSVLTGRPNRREAKFSTHFNETPPPGTTIRLSNVN